MRRIAILGSTGSIGTSTLRLLEDRRDLFEVVLLAARSSAVPLAEQGRGFEVPHLCLTGLGAEDATSLELGPGQTLHRGDDGLLRALETAAPDLVLNAVVGSAGLHASVWTLEQGLPLLLANKESLVCAGPLLMDLAHRHQAEILPVDSEHAAIHQCLRGERREDLRRIYLTASGGPFRDHSVEEIAGASVEEALDHPTWKMGPRITIGSATLMNKTFEVLEAWHLFGLEPEQIEVLIHRQSIVHSMVEFRDASLMAQLGLPDMRVPILYCLGWPDRLEFDFEGFSLSDFSKLSFEKADTGRFPALTLGPEVMRLGGDSGAVLNAADEVATQAFLDRGIPFPQITETVARVLEGWTPEPIESIEQVLAADARARSEAEACLTRPTR